MDWINIEKLRKYSAQESYKNQFYIRVERLIEYLQESTLINNILEEEHLFYPKYLWQEDNDLELYFFTKEHIVLCSLDSNQKLFIIKRFTRDISKIEITNYDANHRDIQLIITFVNKDEIILQSNDTNEHWKFKYFKKIQELYNFIN
ncbi:DUF3908 family protein [Evansella clarkii]|uniref:DUF3908 family protein n=1 Tax=Evansella clarkii TaxID=79879 RepID=UPI0009979FD7|nr:DUF3908 family protein [Evansella clarkii]